MKQFTSTSNSGGQPWFQYFLFLAAIACVILLMPLSPHFQYEYETSRPWAHEDLIAPITFPIVKSESEIREEQAAIIEDFVPFYIMREEVPQLVLDNFEQKVRAEYENENIEQVLHEGRNLLQDLYQNGVIHLEEEHALKSDSDEIRLMENRVVRSRQVGYYISLENSREKARERTTEIDVLDRGRIRTILREVIEPNLVYDEELSNRHLQEKLDAVGQTRGVVEAGETIIRYGEIVTEEKDRILHSLRNEYREKMTAGDSYYFVISGYILIVALLFLIFFFYLRQFHYDYLSSYRSLIMVLVNMLIFIGISSYIVSDPSFSIYLIPFCIVPIILIAFFGSRLAFITHMIVVMLVALMVENSSEFIIVQFLAGFAATLSMLRVRYLSQFFAAVLLTFAAYCLGYLALNLLQTGNFTDLNYTTFFWFGGNFILTLLAYPLIYAHEKIYGFVSDITLLELGDVNNSLLRELSIEAPGTFQHSLQVANLSETLLNAVHGNALLARVAALYHDIGKMKKPEFFIENQRYITNPHDELDAEESCQIIIDHVQNGVEIAEKHNLPEPIVDIIRTHHGTSRMEYFYRNEISKYSEAQVDEMKFRYPGPKPRSKEEAVIMITDSAEAASRAIKNPDGEALDNLVEKIIESKLEDKQLENAEITLKEINTIKELLKKLLKSLYHVRIEYPEETTKPKENP